MARPQGAWNVFGDLRVDVSSPAGSGDESISFDPVLHQLDGLSYDEWVVRLREGAYRAARWSRARRGRAAVLAAGSTGRVLRTS